MAENNKVNWSTDVTGFDSDIVKWTYFAFIIILILLCFYFIKKALDKINKVKDPEHNNSYC